MSTKAKLNVNVKDFLNDFNIIALKTIPLKVEKGAKIAGLQWKHDADNIEPKTPHDTGHLKRTGRVIPGDAGLSKTKNAIVVSVIYNTKYAAIVHDREEGVAYKKPGTGSQFLISKADSRKDIYMQIIAAEVK